MVGQEPVRQQVLDALSDLSAAIDRLHAMGDATDFAALGPEGLIEAMRTFEVQRNRLSTVDHAFIEAAEIEQLWEHTTARGVAGALAQLLHLASGEAHARVRAAKWFLPRVSMDGQEIPPALAATAAAQREGAVTPAQASVIGHCVDELGCKPELSTAEVEQAETALVDYAAAFGPRGLHRVADKIVDVLIPDGTPPRDPLVDGRRGITIGKQRRDGTATIRGVLTPEVRAQLWAVLSPLAAPRPTEGGRPDTRSAPQRTHDALGECARCFCAPVTCLVPAACPRP